MTQLDGAVPWQRRGYEPDLGVHVSGADSYGASPGYVETVDPYLGTLRSYPRPSEHVQPSRTLYVDLSSPLSSAGYAPSPPSYQPAYSWDRPTIDPLDPSFDVLAAAGQSRVVDLPLTYEYPSVPATFAAPAETYSYPAPAESSSYAASPKTYSYPAPPETYSYAAATPDTYGYASPSTADAYTAAPVDAQHVTSDDTAVLPYAAPQQPPEQTYAAPPAAQIVAHRGADSPSRSDFPFRNVPPHGGTPPSGDMSRDVGISESPRPLRARSTDERMTWLGAALGGFALAFIVYDRLLPFQGVVGFVIVYQLFRLALLGTVTALSHPRPVVIDRLATAGIRLGARLVFGALAWTIGFVIFRGWRTLHHVAFYTHTMAGVLPQSPVNQGGVFHALVGSGIELTIATIITLPLGIMTAVYMTEVGGKLAQIVRTVIEAMTSLPDLLAGLFIYTLLIIGLGFDRSGLAAALALAITMLPLVARSAEVALRVVPAGLRDAGVALGSTQWRTVLQVVLPTAAPGLATALIIAVARAVGETAPVLVTSGASTFMNVNPVHNPMNSLPLFIYASLRSGEPNSIARGFGAAVLLLVVVVIFFVLIRLVASRSVKTR